MNRHFEAYIRLGREIARTQNVEWDLPIKADGKVADGYAWNLTFMAGGNPPPFHWINDFGLDNKLLAHINTNRAKDDLPALPKAALSKNWQDLIKSSILEQTFLKKNTTSHTISNIYRPLKVLATCCMDKQPWEINADDVRKAHQLAQSVQACGQLADRILGNIKNIFDVNHLADASPLYPTLLLDRNSIRLKRSKMVSTKEQLLDSLEDRKNAEKLPDRRALWELVRIVFTEKPKTFLDLLRFAQLKVMLLCGLRIGEVVLLPQDWKILRQYFNYKGTSASELGGFSHSLLLRHFAEKQQQGYSDSNVLFETTQFVPAIFEDILTETLDQIVGLTNPLRDTLKRQTETNRLLPWYEKDQVVPAYKLYTHLTGNPVAIDMDDADIRKYQLRYLENFDPKIFSELHQSQFDGSRFSKFNMAFYVYFNRMKDAIVLRYSDGSVMSRDSRIDWLRAGIRIDELENYLATKTKTKLSDTLPFLLNSGELKGWELMFLMPKRSLIEGRNEGMCDVTRYFSVGRMDETTVQNSLGGKTSSVPSLFEVYGQTDQDKELTLKSHSLRHLQNTELFRQGVADTIISKRFNRRSVKQSYEYDHRSLAEELDSISIPPEVEIALGEKAATVARLISAGKATGPIVQSFRNIQQKHGDNTAFEYLKAEADGFHSTPYGHCINSFTVDPCPKHLECFAGCRHLTATNLSANKTNLIHLEERIASALDAVKSRSSNSLGRTNQIAHAESRLNGIRRLLSTQEGQVVFPEGQDFSQGSKRDLFDGKN